MSDAATPAPEVNDARPLNNPDLVLSFAVGNKRVPINLWTSLQPGYVFELDGRIDCPINIRVGDHAVGKGELVAIGDRLGVRVVKFTEHGND